MIALRRSTFLSIQAQDFIEDNTQENKTQEQYYS